MEIGDNDKIIATTKVLIPQGDGPIKATSIIEAVPQPKSRKHDEILTAEQPYNTKPYESFIAATEEDRARTPIAATSPKRRSMKIANDFHMPSAPPLHEVNGNQKLILNLQGRQHAFGSKTFLRSDTCTYCLKRWIISFVFASNELQLTREFL